jgi:hypothetical protein
MSDPNAQRDADANPDEEQAVPESAEAETEADEPAEFENRAARRARGKGTTEQKLTGTTKRLDGRTSVQGPRQYGARRSG